MIKAIIFDYGGVLSVHGHLTPYVKALAEKKRRDPIDAVKVMHEAWNLAKTEQIPSSEFWKRNSDYLGIPVAQLRTDWMNYFGFRAEVLELVNSLHLHYKTAILSNQIRDWLEESRRKYDLDDAFDEIFASYTMKQAKPNPQVYQLAAKTLGVLPSECVFIDDTERNVRAAEQVGMIAIQFTSSAHLVAELERAGVRIPRRAQGTITLTKGMRPPAPSSRLSSSSSTSSRTSARTTTAPSAKSAPVQSVASGKSVGAVASTPLSARSNKSPAGSSVAVSPPGTSSKQQTDQATPPVSTSFRSSTASPRASPVSSDFLSSIFGRKNKPKRL